MEREPLAIKDLAHALEVHIKESDLVIHKDHPLLAASPDGLIGENIIVEVKCPYSARKMTPQDGNKQEGY